MTPSLSHCHNCFNSVCLCVSVCASYEQIHTIYDTACLSKLDSRLWNLHFRLHKRALGIVNKMHRAEFSVIHVGFVISRKWPGWLETSQNTLQNMEGIVSRLHSKDTICKQKSKPHMLTECITKAEHERISQMNANGSTNVAAVFRMCGINVDDQCFDRLFSRRVTR